jgi:DNA-directed RNA polymerase subunit K/omega
VVEENTVPSDLTEEQAQPEAASFAKVPPPESRFLFVDVAALRAKQLRRGARPRVACMGDAPAEGAVDLPRKPERVAMEEVRQGLVLYDLPGPTPAPTADVK